MNLYLIIEDCRFNHDEFVKHKDTDIDRFRRCLRSQGQVLWSKLSVIIFKIHRFVSILIYDEFVLRIKVRTFLKHLMLLYIL